jgi:seryl-tRNA synthetase
MLKPLTVAQLKEVRVLIDEAIQQNVVDLQQTEKERNNDLREIGNHLHDSVPVSNDEVSIDLCYFISASCCINVSRV